MFSRAYEIASRYTRPVIVPVRFFDGTVECVMGAFTILNEEGWVATVMHLFKPLLDHRQHLQEMDIYRKAIKVIDDNLLWDDRKKRKRKAQVKTNPQWITNCSYWWGQDGVRDSEVKLLPEADLAVLRLEPFDPQTVGQYPIIKNPGNLRHGTSLCKLGFPFHQVKAAFDADNGTFSFEPGALPVPRFPIEGIYTRCVLSGKSHDDKYEIKFLETSSPGLRGQSGGPIFDVNATLWAIQCRTINLPLGFSPKVIKNGKEVEENQFLNVGWGIHPELLITFLRDHNVHFHLSED